MNRTSQELSSLVAEMMRERGPQPNDDCLLFAVMSITAALCELRDSIDAIPWRDVGRDDEPETLGTCQERSTPHLHYHGHIRTICLDWQPLAPNA